MRIYVYFETDEQPDDSDLIEYRDSEGNILRIHGDDAPILPPSSAEIVAFLDSYGYDGPGDWQKA